MSKSFTCEWQATKKFDFQIPILLQEKKKCAHMLRTWHGTKHFTMPKTVFKNLDVGMNFNLHSRNKSVHFINEALNTIFNTYITPH